MARTQKRPNFPKSTGHYIYNEHKRHTPKIKVITSGKDLATYERQIHTGFDSPLDRDEKPLQKED